MARIARKNNESYYYHIIAQGYEKSFIFPNNSFIEKYVELLKNEKDKFDVTLLGYCVMNNHVHLLLYSKDISQISSYMRNINFKFAMYYNKYQNRIGYVFRGRFSHESINTERYLYNCLAYIHMNPVKAGMVNKPEEYLYSSYNDFIKKDGIVDSKVLNLLLFNSENYIDFFKFIHLGTDECMEYKTDFVKPSIEVSRKMITDFIEKLSINRLEIEDHKVLIYLFKNFSELGISLKQMQNVLGISYRKFKRILNEE